MQSLDSNKAIGKVVLVLILVLYGGPSRVAWGPGDASISGTL